jgi:hypothetical protein
LTDATPDRNVFILGAGFSRDAGAPLVSDFLDIAREFLDDPNSGLDDEERGLFECVFEFKKRVAQAREKFRIDLDNIEQLFGLIEMSHRLNLDTKSSAVRDAMVYLIAKALQLSTEKKRGRLHIRIRPNPPTVPSPWTQLFHQSEMVEHNTFQSDIYRYFALLLSGKFDDSAKAQSRANVVITFNYDIVLDNALRRIGYDPDYALENAAFDGERNAQKIELLKLHGSTNWAICPPPCSKIQVMRDEKFTNLAADFRARTCGLCNGPLRHLLVPPSWDKSEYREVMRPVWKKAEEALKTAKRICIIGYSMPETDSFFKFLLALGLAENHRLFRFIVVDSTESSGTGKTGRSNIEQRYRRMFEEPFRTRRFDFFGSGFANFLSGAPLAIGRAETVLPIGIVG